MSATNALKKYAAFLCGTVVGLGTVVAAHDVILGATKEISQADPIGAIAINAAHATALLGGPYATKILFSYALN
ncbi:MAG: hypothetical protein PHE27_03775 [Alphaproteobacteria bacterium]|nr:hypothetical protein [Alphaproteobacteria bacterium]